jgi:hypothetical protein
MAINWAVYSTWNISIWVYFDNSDNNKVKVFSYPFDIEQIDIDRNTSWNINLVKEISIQNWVWIESIYGKNNFLFFFNSISWDLKYYYWDWLNKVYINPVSENIDINISYKWSSSLNLQRTLSYFTATNIIDY